MNLETRDWHWKEIFESMHNGVIAINRNKEVIVFNRAASMVLDIPQSQAIGAQIEQVISNSNLIQVMENGTEEHNQRLDINDRSIISNRSPIRSGNKIIGAVAISRFTGQDPSCNTGQRNN